MERCGDCVRRVEAANAVLHTTNTHIQRQLDIMNRERAGQEEAALTFVKQRGSRFSVADLPAGASGRRRRGHKGRSRGRSRGRKGHKGRSRGRKGRSRRR